MKTVSGPVLTTVRGLKMNVNPPPFLLPNVNQQETPFSALDRTLYNAMRGWKKPFFVVRALD